MDVPLALAKARLGQPPMPRAWPRDRRKAAKQLFLWAKLFRVRLCCRKTAQLMAICSSNNSAQCRQIRCRKIKCLKVTGRKPSHKDMRLSSRLKAQGMHRNMALSRRSNRFSPEARRGVDNNKTKSEG